MLEEVGCFFLVVYGRIRDQKDQRKIRVDWSAIRVVKDVVRILVFVNGNIRYMDDVSSCLEAIGVEGVFLVDVFLENSVFFVGFRIVEWVGEGEERGKDGNLDQVEVLV